MIANKNDTESEARDFYIVVIGPGGVGKTTLMHRWIFGTFRDAYDPTIELTHDPKMVLIDSVPAQITVTVTAGQEEYGALRDSYIKAANGVLLVYSITSRTSFEAATALYRQVLRIKDTGRFPLVLMGNKEDMREHREVPTELAMKFVREQKLIGNFFETSAKTPLNIEESLFALVRAIRAKRKQDSDDAEEKEKCLLM